MRKILFGLLLLLGSSAYAESGGFFGVKLMQDIGMEGGLLWKHVGLKAYCSADYSYSSIYVLGSTNDDSSTDAGDGRVRETKDAAMTDNLPA